MTKNEIRLIQDVQRGPSQDTVRQRGQAFVLAQNDIRLTQRAPFDFDHALELRKRDTRTGTRQINHTEAVQPIHDDTAGAMRERRMVNHTWISVNKHISCTDHLPDGCISRDRRTQRFIQVQFKQRINPSIFTRKRPLYVKLGGHQACASAEQRTDITSPDGFTQRQPSKRDDIAVRTQAHRQTGNRDIGQRQITQEANNRFGIMIFNFYCFSLQASHITALR